MEDVSNGRLALWESSVEIWSASPILGTGYNSFLPFVREHVPQSYVINNSQGAYVSLHNEYINILVYQGVLGFGLFAASDPDPDQMVQEPAPGKQEDRDYICVLTGCVWWCWLPWSFLWKDCIPILRDPLSYGLSWDI